MSARDGYQAGVPCWVAAVLPDAAAGVAFYTGLFGWEAADIMPPDGPGRYFVCTLGGQDATATRAADLGGKVLAPPFDSPAGRTGVLADPQGASFTVSESPVPA